MTEKRKRINAKKRCEMNKLFKHDHMCKWCKAFIYGRLYLKKYCPNCKREWK